MPRRENSDNKQTKLRKLIRLIAFLRSNKWTITQLASRLEMSKSSVYRYLELLEEEGFYIDEDNHHRHFIAATENDPIQTHFTIEEAHVMRALLHAYPTPALKDSMLKKLSILSEQGKTPEIFLKAHLGDFVEQLNQAMRNKNQVWLKLYCSANGNDVRDRLIEPINFGVNYGTIVGLDTEDGVIKQFKLDRVGDIEETHTKYQSENLHKHTTSDIFGLSGENEMWVKLKLKLRAYLLLQEEFPLAKKYLSEEKGSYLFHGPVTSFEGIGRFVLGLIREIEIIESAEFRQHLICILDAGLQRVSKQ